MSILGFRIQQIQLLGRDLRGSEHDKLWNQLEAEIHLHRHKTVIRACRGRGSAANAAAAASAGGGATSPGSVNARTANNQDGSGSNLARPQGTVSFFCISYRYVLFVLELFSLIFIYCFFPVQTIVNSD